MNVKHCRIHGVKKPRDVEKLLVFEDVVYVAVFVPGSLGDPQHQFSTKVVHHVAEGVRSPVFSAVAVSSSCPRVRVIGRIQWFIGQLVEAILDEIAPPLRDYFVRMDLFRMRSEVFEHVVLLNHRLVRPESLQYHSNFVIVPHLLTEGIRLQFEVFADHIMWNLGEMPTVRYVAQKACHSMSWAIDDEQSRLVAAARAAKFS